MILFTKFVLPGYLFLKFFKNYTHEFTGDQTSISEFF